MAERPQPRQAAHPTPLTYLKVATTLALLTAAEVAVFYIDALEPAFLPLFLILSLAKFALVVMFYMHLRYDSRLFSGVFVGGLLLALTVAVVLLSLFQVLSTVANPREDVEAEEAVAVPSPPAPSEAERVRPPVPPGVDLVSLGRELFLKPPANAPAAVCIACHTIETIPGAAGKVGPDLTHIGTAAATRKPGMSAEGYTRESIKTPEAFVAQGVERSIPGVMTRALTGGLTDEQVEALVAFLLAQK